MGTDSLGRCWVDADGRSIESGCVGCGGCWGCIADAGSLGRSRTGTARVFAPTGPNQVWAYDFSFDHCTSGQTLKSLSIVDEWTRECLAIEVATSLTAGKVITVLERLFQDYGAPQVLRSDNGPEFIARALRIWALMNHSETATIEPGKPWQPLLPYDR